MLKKQSRRSDARRGTRGRKSRVAALIILALVCVISTSLLAQVDLQRRGKRASGEVSVMSLSGPPAKEYIYAGTKLIATVEPTAVNGNDAQFVSMFYKEPCSNLGGEGSWLPIGFSFGVPNQDYLVRVTMQNTGTTTWTSAGNYYLGSQNPANNETWGTGKNRIALPTSVPPTTNVTFEFSVKRPSPSSFNFQWQMVQGSVSSGVFFGEKTRNAVIPSGAWLCEGAPSNIATFVSQSIPALMFAGKTYPVAVTMNNGGTTTWTTGGNYNLGSQLPQDNTYWGTNRVAVPSSISPGSNAVFTFNAAAPATPGIYNFQWMMVQDGGVGFFGYLTPGVAVAVNKKAALGYLDFNNDGKTDIATWRSLDVKWRLDYNLDGVADVTKQFYNSRSDIPVSGDYDGDGKADFAVFRPSTGNGAAYFLDVDRNGFPDPSYPLWRLLPSVPVPGDYDGDGRTDPAVFNPATGGWMVDLAHAASASLSLTFGVSGDIPVPADYNRNGRTDVAVFRPSTGQWFIDTDLNGVADMTVGFGQNGDIPVPMDYNGDGIADIAVLRRSTGQWFIDTNLDGVADLVVGFGVSTDIPVPGDYNGDGKADIAVFRASTGQWLIDTNNNGVADITVAFGVGDPIRQGGWILKAMGILP